MGRITEMGGLVQFPPAHFDPLHSGAFRLCLPDLHREVFSLQDQPEMERISKSYRFAFAIGKAPV